MDLSFLPPAPANHDDKARWLDESARLTAAQSQAERSRSAVAAWLRFAAFAAIGIGVYFLMTSLAPWAGALLVGGIVGFALAVRSHRRLRTRVQTLKLLETVIDESRQRIGGSPGILRDGETPADIDGWRSPSGPTALTSALSAQELIDLDIFGAPLSLFGLLNRTSSPVGAARLADALTHPLADTHAIHQRQAAATWFVEHPKERLQFMAAAAGFRALGKECRKLHQTLRDATMMPGGRSVTIARWWGLAGPVGLLLLLGQQLDWHRIPFAGLPIFVVVGINWFALGRLRRAAVERIRPWLALEDLVSQFRYFCETAAESLPDDQTSLAEARRRLSAAAQSPILPRLEARIPFLFLGLTGFLHTVVDLLVLWDVQAITMIEAVTIRHRQTLLDAVEALGEAEFLACLGAYAWEERGTVQPIVESGATHLEIVEGRHPLIDRNSAVANSVRLGDPVRTWIVTGSNMSGKSTFLRMTATNALLAMTGARVPADAMRLSPFEILTDLRIRDDLSRKESYFLAEVRQVRRMVDAARAGRPVLTLIDEPFRGTNSAERVAAASAVVRSLIAGSGLHLVATHDAALTTLGETDEAENFHFEERFENDGLVFDYRLRDGPARTRNALRVLAVEGYPDDVVEDARNTAAMLMEQDARDKEKCGTDET